MSPVAADLPTLQSMQLAIPRPAPGATLLPPAQEAHVVAAFSAYFPTTHVSQTTDPGPRAKCPAEHAEQVNADAAPCDDCSVPAEQFLHVLWADAPTESLHFPAPHSVQVSLFSAPTESLHFPALHPLHSVAATAGEGNFPAAQGWQASAVLPATPLALPAAHSLHALLCVVSPVVPLPYQPAGHFVHPLSSVVRSAFPLPYRATLHCKHASLFVTWPVFPFPNQPFAHGLHALCPAWSAYLKERGGPCV